jgi:hypothetical protein
VSLVSDKRDRITRSPVNDYRDEDLIFRPRLDEAFGASGSCQCLLTILTGISAMTGISAGSCAACEGSIATGVEVVLPPVGSVYETGNLSAFVEVALWISSAIVLSTPNASALASGTNRALTVTNTIRLAKQTAASQIVLIIHTNPNPSLRNRSCNIPMRLD